VNFNINASDWSLLADMGQGVRNGRETAGIETFEQATEVRSAIAAASGANYNLDDLVCFLCLSGVAGAQPTGDKFPRLPQQVTIEGDLGPMDMEKAESEIAASGAQVDRDESVIAASGAQKRAKVGLEGSEIAASGAQKRAKVDRDGNCEDEVCRAIVLGMVVESDPLPASAQTAMTVSHCCRGLRDSRPNHMRNKRRAVADSVARWINKPDVARVLQEHGISKGSKLRTVACAWDWLEKLPDLYLHPDDSTMGLAMTRMSVKLELKLDCHAAVLELLGSKAQKPTLLDLERRILMVLPRL